LPAQHPSLSERSERFGRGGRAQARSAEHGRGWASSLLSLVSSQHAESYLGDLERVELAIKKGQELGDNNLMVKNGFLLDIADNKPIEIKGWKNLFVRVIEL
jgi:hypothetical protein